MRTGPTIPVAGPWISSLEVEYVRRAAETAWYAGANDCVRDFETAFAKRVERSRAISLPSCTAGIHLILAALGIGPGDEVIVPDITWIASAAPVSYVGATPVFADVDPVTWCLHHDAAERVLTSRTRAIIAVDLYGGMPDMAALTDLAQRHGVALIEDAAEAIGSRWQGRPAGSFGVASVFSFHGSKTLTTGEGGMVVTDDPLLHQRMLQLRDHGRDPGSTDFVNDEIGFKYKMSALQAALGMAQLERLDQLVDRKRELFSCYSQELCSLRGLALNAEPAGTYNSYWMVTAVLDPELGLTCSSMRARLAELGMGTRPFFHPLSSLPAYNRTPGVEEARQRNVVSYRLSPYGINLPSALILDVSDVHRVAAAVRAMVPDGGVG